MSYTPIYARQVEALRREAGCHSTDEYLELLEQSVINLREVYETAPPLPRKAEE